MSPTPNTRMGFLFFKNMYHFFSIFNYLLLVLISISFLEERKLALIFGLIYTQHTNIN